MLAIERFRFEAVIALRMFRLAACRCLVDATSITSVSITDVIPTP